MAHDVLGKRWGQAAQRVVERDVPTTGTRTPLAIHIPKLNAPRLYADTCRPLPDHSADVAGTQGLRLKHGRAKFFHPFFNEGAYLWAVRLEPARDEDHQPDRRAFHHHAAAVLLMYANRWFIHKQRLYPMFSPTRVCP